MKHYTVTTWLNGEQVGHQEIDDPFVTTTVTIGWRDLVRAIFHRREAKVVVNVAGDRHAVFHVMKPVPLLPPRGPNETYGAEASSLDR